jgi:general secretion pathway protein K
MKSRSRFQQRGVALITALLVVAIATVIAVEIAARERLDIRRTQNLLASDQAYDLAVAAEMWALDLLKTDLEEGEPKNLDGAQDNWAQMIVLPPFEGATLGMRIEDLQGRFNLNSLAQFPHEQTEWKGDQRLRFDLFKRLLITAMEGIEVDAPPEALAYALLDWLDTDVEVRHANGSGVQGAEDLAYSGEDRPYRAANQQIASPSELLLVKDFTPQLYERLAPHVTALPEPATRINVNTATDVVLASLFSTGTDNAKKLIELRNQRPNKAWENSQDLTTDAQAAGITVPVANVSSLIDFKSQYFAYHGEVSLGPAFVRLQSMISRTNGIRVLQRARGTL